MSGSGATLREIVLARNSSSGVTVEGVIAVLRSYDVAEAVKTRKQHLEAERQRKIAELRAGKAERLRLEGERRMRGAGGAVR